MSHRENCGICHALVCEHTQSALERKVRGGNLACRACGCRLTVKTENLDDGNGIIIPYHCPTHGQLSPRSMVRHYEKSPVEWADLRIEEKP